MLEKFVKDKKLNAVAEVRLYVMVLEMLDKTESVVQLLESPLGVCVCLRCVYMCGVCIYVWCVYICVVCVCVCVCVQVMWCVLCMYFHPIHIL